MSAIRNYVRKKWQGVADFDLFKNIWSEVLLTLVKIVYTGVKQTDQGGPFFMASQACIEK